MSHHGTRNAAFRLLPQAATLSGAIGAAVVSLATAAQDTRVAVATPPQESAQQIVESWPETAKFAARTTIQQYGPPDEMTPTRLIWFNNGPWKRTIVSREEIDHDFPMPHKDVMEQFVDYEVPLDKLDELANYDGSVYFDRTRGELSARCDMEAANFVALNLAHDVATGSRTVAEAREFYPMAVMAHMQGESSPYAEELQFSAQRGTADPGETIVSTEQVQRAQEIKQRMMRELETAGGRTRN